MHFGGRDRLNKRIADPVLAAIAARHGVTAFDVALAWTRDLSDLIVPIPGATRVETARSLSTVPAISLDDDDRLQLDERFSGRLLRVPRAERRAPDTADGEVVLVMGMPAMLGMGVRT